MGTEQAARLANTIESIRPDLLVIARAIAGDAVAPDVIQDAFLKLVPRTARGEEIGEGLVRTTVQTLALDRRRHDRRSATIADARDLPERNECPESATEIPDSLEPIASDFSPLERQVFHQRAVCEWSHREIAESLHLSEAAVRKTFQRAREKAEARAVQLYVMSGDYRRLNGYRLNNAEARRVALLCQGEPKALEALFGVFERKEYSRAIQNATWILANLVRGRSKERSPIEEFLVDSLQHGNLYRGNKNYVAEALLDLNYRRYIYVVRREFLVRLQDLEDRITPVVTAREEMESFSSRCIYDVKSVRPIGHEVRSDEVRSLRRVYVAGHGSVDFRRCLAFELLRLHPDDRENVRAVMLHLHEEEDPINAYYVTKYLRIWGMEEHPGILDAEVLRAVGRAALRWPKNRYLQQSVDALGAVLWTITHCPNRVLSIRNHWPPN